MRHGKNKVVGYCWLQLPEPRLSLTESSSVAEVEAAVVAVPELARLDLLRLYRPSRFAYCFVSDPLRRAIELAGITGIRFGTSKLFRSARATSTPNDVLQLTGPAERKSTTRRSLGRPGN